MKATKYQKKSLIKLEDLLRRRKTTLKKFLIERGITTYSVLEETCNRLGVVTPGFDAFNACVPSYVSDPTAGVVVVPPLDVVTESTGEKENIDEIFAAIPPTTAYEDVMIQENAASLDDAEVDVEVDLSKTDAEIDTKNSYRKKTKKSGG